MNDKIETLKKENEKLRREIENLTSKRGEQQKSGMIKKASTGEPVSKAPFGYEILNHKLIPAKNYLEVEEIFEEFLQKEMTLTNLAKKRKFSVNGLKKILKNFSYIGKVKFNGQIYNGNHKIIISPILFNKVQDKLERMKIK